MSPKRVLSQNRSKLNNLHNNIYAKKLNRIILTNTRLRKRIALLSFQNKELSATRNSLLLEKIKLENERNSIKNSNIQLTAMLHTGNKKLGLLEQNLQTCVPALVTLSKCIPSMMESVREISKLDKFNEFSKVKKERLTKSVKPMVNGFVIEQPAVKLKRLNLSSIIECSSPEQSPMLSRRSHSIYSSNRSSPQVSRVSLEPRTEARSVPSTEVRSELRPNIHSEPYVRLKDVAALLKNSKAVTNKNSPRRQPDNNLGEGPSWLHAQENQTQNSVTDNSITENSRNYSVSLNEITTSMTNEMATQVPNEISTPVREDTSTYNEVQVDMSISNELRVDMSISNALQVDMNNQTNTTSYNEAHHNESMTPEPSMLRNITCRRKRYTPRSSESSIISDNESNSSQRSKRSGKKKVDYKENKLNTKLRRTK